VRSREPRHRNPVTPNLKAALQKLLNIPRPRMAVLAIGSTLRGDDAAGVLAARELTKLLSKEEKRSARRATVSVFLGETAPENMTGQIKAFAPTCLVILDAVDSSSKPGSIHLMKPDQVHPGAGLSTHSTSIRLLVDYLRHFLSCDVLIVGIQPEMLEFDHPPSPSVLEAVKIVASDIAAAVTACN
jgi:hydrogenase maturation protease HycI